MIRWIKRAWRRFNGWHDCPLCGEQKLWWMQMTVVFEDEPPLFGRWLCNGCLASTPVLATPIMKKAMREHATKETQEDRT